MLCAISFATMSSSIWRTTMRFSSSTRPAFSSRARRRAAWRGNTPGRQARLRTARSASSLLTFRATVMRLSIARCIFRSNGPTIQIVWKPHTCLPGFATKPKLATRMIARAIAAAVPFKWVAGDTVYGVGDTEQQLRQAGKGYVLGVSSAHVFHSWGKRRSVSGTAADIASTRRSSDWKRLSAGDGTKGPRLHDWCYLELADLDAGQFNSANDGLWTRGLLIRRRIADDDLAFFTTWCPAATSIETLVAVEGHRWAIEDSFETAKNEFGLDHNESRSWHGWHRHVSMVVLAFAMMAVIRHHANPPQPKKRNSEPRQKQNHRRLVIDPMVNPGSSAHRHQARSKADPTRPHHRMVTLAQSSPGDRSARAPQSKTATVMLGATGLFNQPVPKSHQGRVGLRSDRVNRIVAVSNAQTVFGQANQFSRENVRSCDRQAPERNALSRHGGLHQRVRIGKRNACDIAIELQTGRLEPGVPGQVAVDQQRL